MSWSINPAEKLAELQKAQNILAGFNGDLAESLRLFAEELKIDFWFWMPSVNEVDLDDRVPFALRPTWNYSGTAFLPLSDSWHFFANRPPLASPPAKGDLVVLVQAAPNRGIVDYDFEAEEGEEIEKLSPGPAFLRIQLYKVVEEAPNYDTLEALWNETGDYATEPGFHDTDVLEMRVWVGDFSLTDFLADPKALAREIAAKKVEKA